MPSFYRRKGAAQPAKNRPLLDLPVDVLILIYSQCRIDDLLAFRLTNSRSRDLIDKYIATIAPSVARSTFPHCDHLLARFAESSKPFTLHDLKNLIPEHLASVLVDCHRTSTDNTMLNLRYGVPAEDPYGDDLRDRIARGWRVFYELSRIYRQVHNDYVGELIKTPADLVNNLFRPSYIKASALKQKEDLILQRRLAYIESKPREVLQDYRDFLLLLSAVINTSLDNTGQEHVLWPFDFGHGLDSRRMVRRGETWFTWFLLSEGPEMFWQQWWMLPRSDAQTTNYIRDRALGLYEKTPENLAWYQGRLAESLHKRIEKRAVNPDPSQGPLPPITFFTGYAHERRRREAAGLPPIKEIMGDVPFHVNFKCPPETVEYHEAVQAMKAARPTQLEPRLDSSGMGMM